MGTRFTTAIILGLLACATTGTARAGDHEVAQTPVADTTVVGEWTGGTLGLSVDADGRFDWSVGDRVTDGTWTRGAQLLSLATDQWKRVYAYRVEGDTLTLFDVDGTELVMRRVDKRSRRSARL